MLFDGLDFHLPDAIGYTLCNSISCENREEVIQENPALPHYNEQLGKKSYRYTVVFTTQNGRRILYVYTSPDHSAAKEREALLNSTIAKFNELLTLKDTVDLTKYLNAYETTANNRVWLLNEQNVLAEKLTQMQKILKAFVDLSPNVPQFASDLRDKRQKASEAFTRLTNEIKEIDDQIVSTTLKLQEIENSLFVAIKDSKNLQIINSLEL